MGSGGGWLMGMFRWRGVDSWAAVAVVQAAPSGRRLRPSAAGRPALLTSAEKMPRMTASQRRVPTVCRPDRPRVAAGNWLLSVAYNLRSRGASYLLSEPQRCSGRDDSGHRHPRTCSSPTQTGSPAMATARQMSDSRGHRLGGQSGGWGAGRRCWSRRSKFPGCGLRPSAVCRRAQSEPYSAPDFVAAKRSSACKKGTSVIPCGMIGSVMPRMAAMSGDVAPICQAEMNSRCDSLMPS